MPLSIYQSNNKGSWDATQARLFSATAPADAPALGYEFLLWYPVFQFTNIPINVSKKFKFFGTKHYLGEVAYINFGSVANTEYIQFERHQGQMCLALPLPVYVSGVDSSGASLGSSSFYPNNLRARSLSWDFEVGVTFTLEIYWQLGRIRYLPGISTLEVI